MKKPGNLLDKNKLILYTLVIVICFLAYTVTRQEPQVSIKPIKETKMTQVEKMAKESQELRERLARLEPLSPVKIIRNDLSSFPEGVPVLNIMAEGTSIPFEVVYENPSWVRPVYEPYWHTSAGLRSSIPDLIHNSYHRLFVTPGTETLWNETIHDSGIAELAEKIKLPSYGSKSNSTIAIVSIRHKVIDVIVLDNQVVLVGIPSRTGVNVLAVDKEDLINSVSGEILAKNNSREYVFHLVTPDGYEFDYNTALVSF